jgi:hypothetical protein
LKNHRGWMFNVVLLLLIATTALAQSTGVAADAGDIRVAVPPYVNYSGVLADASGKPLTGKVEVTFYLYKEQEGGDPLWMETQDVQPDETGRYSVMLGSTRTDGLPSDIFAAGEAHWLGIQVRSEREQPRVLLLSVPYALKAADAETIGGLPPSAFVLTGAAGTASVPGGENPAATTGATGVTTSGGTADQLAKFDSKSGIADSIVTDTGTRVGINTTAPASTLDVNGSITIRGGISLPSSGIADKNAGANSQPLNQTASTFNSSTGKEEKQWFQWQVEPVHNNTFAPAGVMSLLTSQNGKTPVETGLKINQAGIITFAKDQTFPLVTPAGNITGVTAGTDLTGGGTSGNVTLNVDTTRVATLNSINNGQLNVDGNNGGAVINATQIGLGNAVSGVAEGTDGTGVFGSGAAAGVAGTVLSTTGIGVSGTGGSNGIGVKGTSTDGTGVSASGSTGVSATGTQRGVFSVGSGSSSSGVVAIGQGSGVVALADAASGKTTGVFASASSLTGTGALGFTVGESHTGQGLIGCCAVGVWGDTNQTTGGAAGLAGTADDAQALFLGNNSVNHLTAWINNYENTSEFVPMFKVQGVFGSCYIDTSGELDCDGPGPFAGSILGNSFYSAGDLQVIKNAQISGDLFVTGTKSSVVPVDNGTRKVALYAVESPENWFEDYGGGKLEDGHVIITLEPVFQQTVNTNMEYRVFLTPKGDCEGLYITNETPQGFEVRELHGGHSSVEFDYRILAHRKGYENLRLQDRTEEENRARKRMEEHSAHRVAAEQESGAMSHAMQHAFPRGVAADPH